MFSTSMMASSTTAPRAMMSPANVMVLTVSPRQCSTSSVAINDSGIVSMLISATRHSKRKRARMTTTSTNPRISAWVRLWIEAWMKLACWKIVVSNWTPGRPGSRVRMASSTPRVISTVFAHGSFSTTSSRPGSSLMTASPISG